MHKAFVDGLDSRIQNLIKENYFEFLLRVSHRLILSLVAKQNRYIFFLGRTVGCPGKQGSIPISSANSSALANAPAKAASER